MRRNPHPISLSISDAVAGSVRLGQVSASSVRVRESTQALLDEMQEVANRLADRYEGRPPAEIIELRPARELYRSFGIDPTKTRPSSEALLRRALKRKPLPRIINAVDLCNLLSLRFLLPIGLYDTEKIEIEDDGAVLLRRGEPGESYTGIRKADVHLEGRPVLIDRRGPFGNPTSDSLRTSVDASTTSLWMVIFAPASVPSETMEANVGLARESMARHLSP